MPEIGGKKLAGELGAMLQDVRRLVDEVRLDVAGAATELASEIRGGKDVAKALRAEAAEVRKAFSEVLGNQPPADDEGEKG